MNGMRLRQWQDQLVASIIDTDQATVEQSTSEPDDRLAIYRNNCRHACAAALAKTFPICEQVVGGDCFTRLCYRYIATYPPQQANLNLYGETFSQFVEQEIAGASPLSELKYLADVAALEWQLQRCDYALNDERISDERLHTLAGLSDSDQLGVRFILREHISVISSRYPLHLLWAQHKLADGETTGTDDQLHLEPGQYYFCIYRDEYKPVVELIDGTDFQLLSAVLSETTMNDLIESLPEVNERLPKLIARQWIKDFSHA